MLILPPVVSGRACASRWPLMPLALMMQLSSCYSLVCWLAVRDFLPIDSVGAVPPVSSDVAGDSSAVASSSSSCRCFSFS